MTKNLVPQLRYLGMVPHIGHREYRFQIENHDKSIRKVALTIDDHIFQDHRLLFQEAPDLCYQKMLGDFANETTDSPVCNLARVTEAEVASHRNSHPNVRMRRTAARQNEQRA